MLFIKELTIYIWSVWPSELWARTRTFCLWSLIREGGNVKMLAYACESGYNFSVAIEMVNICVCVCVTRWEEFFRTVCTRHNTLYLHPSSYIHTQGSMSFRSLFVSVFRSYRSPYLNVCMFVCVCVCVYILWPSLWVYINILCYLICVY